MTEFQRINALLMSFRASLRNRRNRTTVPAKRDQADVLRVRYWYEGLRQRTGLATAYKLEQHFEPESFRKRDGITSNRCKWQRYAAGRHTPQAKLAARIDARVPGSLQELQHPLWAILKHQPSRTTLSEAFLQRLKPDVQAVLFEPVGGIEVYWQRARVSVVLMRKLERIASLDALAALTWLLREAIALGNRKNTERLAHSIYTVLLIMGIEWQNRELAEPLLKLFAYRILPLGSPPHRRFCMSGRDMLECSAALNLIVYQTTEGKRRGLTWLQRVHIMRRLLAGMTGVDVVHALAPQYIPSGTDVPAEVLHRLEQDERWRQWGWSSINSTKPEPFPPKSFWTQRSSGVEGSTRPR
ncbi:hypothetical protein [Aquipseudomonas alcaligenes]|uniref:Uncharacterized protein n=1 Tax=Aquipseudomonas alcaligenes (strain ATCC 14909 / DSM 50342 / CCUG 1425 / JCM 20561 / NBRC 14159 / NCIMB 9945 / NCTC 10367 / 1577) TaxID=1215092 RepID=U3B4X6_AQUA1|nr:hypothetical protein [Pseudomonas alcaligenes]GAD64889.1 hypothetical protein PA6_052_00130 [Pseudomonas alcaligenes NBRC 14159]SUD12942.1 Uncharacterised protein [Pseudomonas alcaligenes]